MYVIARNTGEWNFIKVENSYPCGGIFTQKEYDEELEKCTHEDTFILL